MTFQMPKLTGFTMPEYTVPVISKDPPKSYHTSKWEPVNMGDVTYMLRSEEQDRLTENINQYGLGHDPMAKPGSKMRNNMTFIQGETLPQVKYSASNISTQFRPNVRLEDEYALSRMPWRFTQNQECNTKVEVLPQKEPETRFDPPELESKTQGGFQCGNSKGQYSRNSEQIHLTEFTGVIVDDPILAFVTTECSKLNKNRPDILELGAIKARMKELQNISVFAPKNAYLAGKQYQDIPCYGYDSWKNDNHKNISMTATKKFYANGDNRVYTADVRNRENRDNIAINGNIVDTNRYVDNRGIVGREDFIKELVQVESVTTFPRFLNATGLNQGKVNLNSRGKELIKSSNVGNKVSGIVHANSNVVERMQGEIVDLANTMKMAL